MYDGVREAIQDRFGFACGDEFVGHVCNFRKSKFRGGCFSLFLNFNTLSL